MKSNRDLAKAVLAGLSCAVLCLLLLTSEGRAQEARIITFDAPGADTTPGDYNGTYPSAINAWGVITGAYQSADTVLHGFIRTPTGKFIIFQAPGADTTPGSYNGTYPNSINDLGAVTGAFWDVTGSSHGFVRTPEGKFTIFDVPDATSINPISINLEGAVVGVYTDLNLSFRAFLRTPDGKITTWIGPEACTTDGSQGCFGSGASAVNAFGIIAGGYEDNSGNFVHHSFLRTHDGKLKTIDVPGAGSGSYQGTGCPGCYLGLNQFGAIAGIYSDANSVNHGFLRTPSGTITTFDAPGAGTASGQGTGCFSDCFTSINDWGAITGAYTDNNWFVHGYLRTPNGKIVTVDPKEAVYTFTKSINDSGAITGFYVDANNVYHGFAMIAD
jgi:hypothetical protein